MYRECLGNRENGREGQRERKREKNNNVRETHYWLPPAHTPTRAGDWTHNPLGAARESLKSHLKLGFIQRNRAHSKDHRNRSLAYSTGCQEPSPEEGSSKPGDGAGLCTTEIRF